MEVAAAASWGASAMRARGSLGVLPELPSSEGWRFAFLAVE